MTIGLIGYGTFGRFLAPHLAKSATVHVYDRRPSALRRSRGRIRRASLAVAASRDVVVLALPLSSLRAGLREIRPHLRAGALVLDVCAAKVLPSRWMKRLLPVQVSIVGTHPLFGPSGASLKGRIVVLCPVRISPKNLAAITRLLRRKGLRPAVMTEEAHDLMVAETIFLTQYAGRLFHSLPSGVWGPVTPNYASLRKMVETAEADTWEMFEDMVRYNRHTIPLLKALRRGHAQLERRLRGAGGHGADTRRTS